MKRNVNELMADSEELEAEVGDDSDALEMSEDEAAELLEDDDDDESDDDELDLTAADFCPFCGTRLNRHGDCAECNSDDYEDDEDDEEDDVEW